MYHGVKSQQLFAVIMFRQAVAVSGGTNSAMVHIQFGYRLYSLQR